MGFDADGHPILSSSPGFNLLSRAVRNEEGIDYDHASKAD